ncbi:hypothetical protein ETAE_3040 [Edwardsiella piscicida]|uniref:Uncharacterized protein n=1 Tax=Edwardsiella piscicida TaxID=1263550 RepID=A0AAU8PB35_EDWPI|nr:hypothetical protein ETAE_3040 [Edwardsiella tarda EIB202]
MISTHRYYLKLYTYNIKIQKMHKLRFFNCFLFIFYIFIPQHVHLLHFDI